MASIEEVKAGIAQAVDKVTEGGGKVQQTQADYEAALAALQQVTEGSGQADVSTAAAQLQQAIQLCGEAFQSGEAGKQAAEAVAARL